MEQIISSLLNVKELLEQNLQRFDVVQQHLNDFRDSHNKMHEVFRQHMNEWESNFNESFNHLKDQIGEIGKARTIQDDDVHAASDEENVKGQEDQICAMHEDEEQAMADSFSHFIFNPSCLSQIPISSPPQWISFPRLASALSWGPSKLSFLRKQLQIETRQQEKEHVSSSTGNDSRGTRWSFDPGGTVIGCKIDLDPKPSKALKLLQSLRPIHLPDNEQPNPNENEGQSSTNSNQEEYGKQAFQVFNKIQLWDRSFPLKNSCNLDEAIAHGAAIQAANLGDVGNEKILISRNAKLLKCLCILVICRLRLGEMNLKMLSEGLGAAVYSLRKMEHIFQFTEEDPNTKAHLAKNLRGKKFFAHHLLVVLLLRGVFEPFDRGREPLDILLGSICSRTSQFALDMKGVLSRNGSHLASTYSALAILNVDGMVRNESSKNSIERQLIENDGQGLHDLALNKMVLDALNFYMTDLVKISFENLELMARNCGSLVFVKVSDCEISFRTANALEEFYGGSFNDHPRKYSSVLFPKKLCRLGLTYMGKNKMPIAFLYAPHLKKMDLLYPLLDAKDHYMSIQRSPNLEIFDMNLAPHVLDFLPLIVVFIPFDKGKERNHLDYVGEEGMWFDVAIYNTIWFDVVFGSLHSKFDPTTCWKSTVGLMLCSLPVVVFLTWVTNKEVRLNEVISNTIWAVCANLGYKVGTEEYVGISSDFRITFNVHPKMTAVGIIENRVMSMGKLLRVIYLTVTFVFSWAKIICVFLGNEDQQLILGQAWVYSTSEIILMNFNHVFGGGVGDYEMDEYVNEVAEVLSTLRTRFFEGDGNVTSLIDLDSPQAHGPPLPFTLLLFTLVSASDYCMGLWLVTGVGLSL